MMRKHRWPLALALWIGISFAGIMAAPVPAQAQAQGNGALPFTADQNKDGARWVWLAYKHAGCPFRYLKANTYPKSKQFGEVSVPQAGDIAWWPDFVSIYDAHAHRYINADGPVAEDLLNSQIGKPHFYRYLEKGRPKACR